MNSTLLLGIMTLYGDGIKDLAQYLGRTEQIVSKKIREKDTEFHLSEIRKIKKRYKLSQELVDAIFFADEVSKLDTSQKEVPV